MNKVRRANLKRASDLLDSAIGIVRDVKDEEQDCLDNMPENLQSSERCEAMESAIDSLEDALDRIDEAKSSINEAIS